MLQLVSEQHNVSFETLYRAMRICEAFLSLVQSVEIPRCEHPQTPDFHLFTPSSKSTVIRMKIRVEEIFGAVADLPPEARARYFTEHDIGPSTRMEVEELMELDWKTISTVENGITQLAQEALELEMKRMHCGSYILR